MATIFSRIIAGEIPSFKIAENDQFYAFLDVFPLVPGHTLVVPKKETDKLFDMDAQDLGAVLQFAQPIARAIEKAFPCKRCGMAVIGLEVPHAHVHLVPIDTADDLNFTRPKLKPSQDELKEAQQKILQVLNP
jgi:histidine triad (HIT) family protein